MLYFVFSRHLAWRLELKQQLIYYPDCCNFQKNIRARNNSGSQKATFFTKINRKFYYINFRLLQRFLLPYRVLKYVVRGQLKVSTF